MASSITSSGGRPTSDVEVARLDDGARTSSRDHVVIEEPLEILLNGAPLCVTMRTPGHDADLVYGFLWSESIVESLDEVEEVSDPEGPRGAPRVHVRVRESVTARRHRTRAFRANASCGVCGLASAELLGAHGALRVGPDRPRVARDTLFALPERLRAAQAVFATTGGLHAAALFTPGGDLVVMREDVGRHNALDKVIGAVLRTRPADPAESIVLVSGRVSFELVAKALSLGVPIVAAISAPSSLALEVGAAHGMTIVGFLRGRSANVYCGGERLA